MKKSALLWVTLFLGLAACQNSKTMTQREMNALRLEIARCLNMPESNDSHKVVVHAHYDPQGNLIDVDLLLEYKLLAEKDKELKIFADNALKAVRACSPMRDLPKSKYEIWKDIIIEFDSSQIKELPR